MLLAETGDREGAKAELERLANDPHATHYVALVGRILGRSRWADEMMRKAMPSEGEGGTVHAFNAGTITSSEFLAAAAEDPNPHKAALQVGEAHFHIAHSALAEGDRKRAVEVV